MRFKRILSFTMAEVLITLGIIGIVAAMTLPALIQKYQKQETSARLKKFYTTMNQAIMMSEIDNGDMRYWILIQQVIVLMGRKTMQEFPNCVKISSTGI